MDKSRPLSIFENIKKAIMPHRHYHQAKPNNLPLILDFPEHEEEMSTEQKQKLEALENSIEGLQRAIRSQSNQTYQISELLGQVNQTLEVEKTNVKRLQLEMEKVYNHLNKAASQQ